MCGEWPARLLVGCVSLLETHMASQNQIRNPFKWQKEASWPHNPGHLPQVPIIMENQMEKKMENEMETGYIGDHGGLGFPKVRCTLLGVPIRRIIIYWGLYWVPLF